MSHPRITLQANYNLNGKILVLPIVGEGPCTLELSKIFIFFKFYFKNQFFLDNLKATLTIIGKTVEKKGETYMKIVETKVSLNPEKVGFSFENLFNGDQQLGAAMNKVLNENDLLVFEDVKSGYEEFLAIVIQDIVNKIFEHVPFKSVFPA